MGGMEDVKEAKRTVDIRLEDVKLEEAKAKLLQGCSAQTVAFAPSKLWKTQKSLEKWPPPARGLITKLKELHIHGVEQGVKLY
jgi:hypothetical protein